MGESRNPQRMKLIPIGKLICHNTVLYLLDGTCILSMWLPYYSGLVICILQRKSAVRLYS